MMTADQVRALAAGGETFTVELKSERRARLGDQDVYEAVVCLANADGGTLLIGVENDGTITGARPRHQATTEPVKLQAAIFNNTHPSINTRVSVVDVGGTTVVAVEVDPYPQVCATQSGKCLRRVLQADGPQCVPFYPHEHVQRRSDLGLADLSAQVVADVEARQLDPLQFERARRAIRTRHGDQKLLALSDLEMAKALRVVESQGGKLVATLAGLLLFGREEDLLRHVPTHKAAFQVLDEKADVRMNDFFTAPLLETIEAVESRFDARNDEKEVLVGMIRVPIPSYSREAFREATLNALLHRDFSQLGVVHVQWHPDHLLITNPGGFLAGIGPHNVLSHEPRPRNPRLYAAMNRLGLVEYTARGVDKIFVGQARYGRPAPDYSSSDATGVRVVLYGGKASLEFAAFVAQQERQGSPITTDQLLILNALHLERRIDTDAAARTIQESASRARAVLEALVEHGWVEAKGEKRGRVYHLSASVYRQLGEPGAYVRVHGISAARQEALVLEYVTAHGRIERKHVVELCGLNEDQSSRLLAKMTRAGRLARRGTSRKGAYYVIPSE